MKAEAGGVFLTSSGFIISEVFTFVSSISVCLILLAAAGLFFD
jgi:hypothetical protein